MTWLVYDQVLKFSVEFARYKFLNLLLLLLLLLNHLLAGQITKCMAVKLDHNDATLPLIDSGDCQYKNVGN